ncbi:MAG: glycosyl hydrolase, partial [Thermoanaerobaculia bacterium]
MRTRVVILFVGLLIAGVGTSLAAKSTAAELEPTFDEKLFQAMEFRHIGPYRGGRVTAVTGIVGDSETYYMGSTGGGVWKTRDAGVSWKNISDEHFAAASVGAIAVAQSDPNVIFVGTGSACPRGNVSPGIGVYRSTDAGKTWTHVGLDEAGQIARIRIHPQDPDLVYVAALGHIFGPNEERGVFRSADGGESWEKVLFVSDRAGAVDLAMSPGNPRILFAGIWEAERKPWTMLSGGEEGGLYRSTDGGDTWEELTEGLPDGMTGRIGVTVSAANPDRVWALIEAEEGGLFRSEDGGDTFNLINSDRNFRQRAWYYTHVFADPRDPETVYILNVGMWRSVDGGKTFSYVRAPHGDHHDLWIQPVNPQVLINGNDGGANVSFNGGRTWSSQAIQPTSEMYRVSVDDQFPYRVYGCQQDNSCVSLPSRTSSSGIARQDWWVIGGCESGHVAIDPRNPEITYSGCYGGQISRYDRATDQNREIMAYPQLAVGQAARDLKYRFQWNAPTRLSPHDPAVLYHTSQYVHRSTDEGQSWEVISPDLTRNDPEKQDYAGGELTWDNTGVEVYDTIFAFEESSQTPGLLWAGTDDGRVHISRDNGANWEEITPAGMPDWGQVNMIELSSHDPGRAFLAVTRYRMDDFRPYIFRTDDYGASWTQLTDGTNGIPEDHFVRVVREDPDRRGLLYAGTEFGLYSSFDDGASWQSFQLELPVTPITDLAVAHQDLVVATQGRSFWILDDLTPLHQLSEEIAGANVHLFEPRTTYRFGGGFSFGDRGAAGKNPPGGVMIYYTLSNEPEEEVTLEILDTEGNVLRSLSSEKEEPQAPNPWRQFFPELGGERKLKTEEGLNRYVWNLRLHDAELAKDAVLWGLAWGPKVPPGSYQARLSVGDSSQTTSFEVKADPRIDTSQSDFETQFALAKSIWQSVTDSHTALDKIRDIRTQVEDIERRLDTVGKGEGLGEAAKVVNDRLTEIEKQIYETRNEAGQDILNYPPKLDNQLVGLMSVVESGDARPTDGAVELYQELVAQLDSFEAGIDAVVS